MLPGDTMRVRKDALSLTKDEKAAFVAGLLRLKKEGRYDEYVHWHHHVMHPTVHDYEPRDALYRNGAHRGPAFLPWHREFLIQVENDLQNIDRAITIPFWDWTKDAALPDPAKSPLWQDDLMGGNGLEADSWRVASGPFAFAGGNWPIPEKHDGPALRRQFGVLINSLPSDADLRLAAREVLYDVPDYDCSPFTIGFRNRIEGWVTRRADHRVTTEGSQLHNRVHLWVGGSMAPMTSPNDPVFFLHHCFVDKVWADWQAAQKQGNAAGAPHYAPLQDGPSGHNFGDVLKPWQRRVQDVIDITVLGYSYEGPPAVIMADVVRLPFAAERSPFWTD